MPLILCYSINKRPIQTWTCNFPNCPEDMREHVRNGGTFSAWNASFERQCFQWLSAHWAWPAVPFDRFRCTMARASALGLPRSLDRIGEALGLEETKDKVGKSLINFFSKPKPDGTFNEPEDHAEKFTQFALYCAQDVKTEMAAADRMIPLSDAEQEVYVLSEKINSRGVRIDRRSAIAAIRLVDKAKAQLDEEMRVITGNAVTGCSQVARLKAWCAEQGVMIAGVAKDDILEALDYSDLPDAVCSALLIRQEAGKSSTTKIASFLNHAGDDDRVRGSFVYHGAAPGRWSNVGVNFANLPRPRAIYDDAELDPATLFAAFRQESPALLKILYGEELGRPLHLISDAIRGFILAAPGHDLIAVDYSGIQGAICAWLTNEEWKLAAMREIIADPEKPDLYRRAAAKIMNSTTDTITKKHWARQLGKVSELALGFQGSVAAFVSMAANYNLKKQTLHDLYPSVWAAADEEAHEKAIKRYERCLKSREKNRTDVLSREGWLACEIVKNGWRASNLMSVAGWKTLEAGMRDAVRNPGVVQRALRVAYIVSGGFLFCQMPSKRCIAYAVPKLKDQVWAKLKLSDGAWTESEVCDRDEAEALERKGLAKIEGVASPKVTALGVDSTTQKMTRYALYGGLAIENAAMSIEADILRIGLRNCERAGYGVVMHCYDEAVAEMPHGVGSVTEMERLMLDIGATYDGLPLDAHGWRKKRYKK